MTNEHNAWAAKVLEQTSEKLVGLEEVVRLCLIAYSTNGHVLLEGNPGLGKTELVKRLAGAIEQQDKEQSRASARHKQEIRAKYGRIQFTPDLMPSDITGTMLPNYNDGATQRWIFEPGPIFTSFLLADEINRATPKTQSALLEAMSEGQVTVLGQTYKLPQPFVVMATQNPIDHSGTYELPEAQADRFLFKINMPVPGEKSIKEILARNEKIARAQAGANGEMASPRRSVFAYANPWLNMAGDVVMLDDLTHAEESFRRRALSVEGLKPQPSVEQHVVRMILASNQRFGELTMLEPSQIERLKSLVPLLFPYGLGPRAAIGLLKATKAWALLFTSDSLERMQPSGRDLAHVVIPTLRHRVKTQFDWKQRYSQLLRDRRSTLPSSDDTLATALADFCINTISSASAKSYHDTVQDELQKVLASGTGG